MTWLEPELDEGAVPVLSPPEVELELPDDCFEELPEPADVEPDELPEECCAVAA